MTEHMVELRNLTKSFGPQTVVNQVNLNIRKGEFLTILGPSGCGKTTTLRLIAGFEHPTAGHILLDGEPVHGRPAYERNVNTVFQNYALFPHLDCFENVAFGLRVKKVPKAQVEERVRQALRLVQLEEYAHRKPDQLSGGQKQRIAIARAVVNNPKVLLLDEPLGALDQKLRKQMQGELKHLQRQIGITFVFVTHDQEEALTMSDRIAVMNQGRLEQVGTPDEIYDQPASTFVAEFIGETNLLPVEVFRVQSKELVLQCEGRTIRARNASSASLHEPLLLSVRPERTSLSPVPSGDDRYNELPARVAEQIYCGATTKTVLRLASGRTFLVYEKAAERAAVRQGDDVYVRWLPADGVVLKR